MNALHAGRFWAVVLIAMPFTEVAAQEQPRDSAGSSCQQGESSCSVVLNMLAAWSTLDSAKIAQYFDNDILYQNTGIPDCYGATEALGLINALLPVFSDINFEVQEVFSRDGLVIVRRIEHWTVSPNPPFGNPNAHLDLPVTGWFRVEHGKIVWWADYWDTFTAESALGVTFLRSPMLCSALLPP